MFSETPSFGARSANHDPTRVWSLYVFLVADRAAKQRVLRALGGPGHEGVTALGTRRGSEHFVIVDYSTGADKANVKRAVLTIDPRATVTFSGRKRQILRNS